MALPKVGAQAVLEYQRFQRDANKLKKILNDILRTIENWSSGVKKAVKGVTDSFDEFTKKSAGMQATMDRTKFTAQESIQIFQDLRKAYGELEKGTEINIDKFDALIAKGGSYKDAFEAATKGTAELASGLGAVGIAITAASTALGVSLKIIRESIEAYEELGREVRRVTYELGVSAIEASGWVDAANRAGVSSATFNRAMVQLSRNIVNYRVDQLKGEESTNKFAKALDALGIDLEGSNRQLKSASQIFTELQQKAQEYGPGVVTLGELSNALGFSTRQLVELLFDESLALDQAAGKALYFGNVIGELDKKQTRELTRSTNDLTAAWQGFKNLLGREFAPAAVKINDLLAKLAFSARMLVAEIGAAELTLNALLTGTIKLSEVGEFYRSQLVELVTGTNAVIEEEEKLQRERDAAVQNTLVLAAAQDDLNDSLDEQNKVLDKLADAWNDYQNRIEDINRRFDDQLEDLEIRQGRDRIERNLKLTHALEDIYIRRDRRLRDISIDLASKQQSLQRDLNRKLEDFERNAARAREKIAVRHRENLLKIENRFNDTVDEAARDNDTVAVVRAIRQRNRSLRDENRRYSVEQDELEKDLAIKRDKINEDARRREQEEKQRADDRRARIQQQFRDEIDDLNRKHQRELILTRNKDEARRQDIERNRAQALRDAQIYYEREEQELRAHYSRLNVVIQQSMTQIANTMMQGYRQFWDLIGASGMSAGVAGIGGIAGAVAGGGGGGTISQWRQHGGVDVVNRPTTFVAGEAGAEIAAFVPLSQSRRKSSSWLVNASTVNVGSSGSPWMVSLMSFLPYSSGDLHLMYVVSP